MEQKKAWSDYRQDIFNFKDVDQNNDKQIDAWIRENTHSGYHLSCTNKMGKVVDAKTAEVFGAKNLRTALHYDSYTHCIQIVHTHYDRAA